MMGSRLLIILCSVLIYACSNDNKDLIHYINHAKAHTVRKQAPTSQVSTLPVFALAKNKNKRNPFKPQVQNRAINPKRIKQALEKFPIASLKFVGTLKQDNQTWALIKQPDQQVILIQAGQYMGQHDGKVMLIANDFIQLEETIKDSIPWRKNTITMKLYTKKQEQVP